MRTIGWLGTGLAVALVGVVVVNWVSRNFDDAQANTDRQTVECLTSRLTLNDKQRIAKFADTNDLDSLWREYDRHFPDCAVRSDQRDRKSELEASAWRLLSYDREFMRLREANAAHAAVGH
ncbi:hypothetical protein A6V36_27180 [Paraburkholderia ginsengiterrae]|uniref:Uncharacterized protein n=1 Tax=Paraburkholderia ginsengiterrae TaxID=1462993 RepID=A0A1A9NEM3_9BURK|nr:hypothetical protein [Paraburkholderia ginsengiterrae]OAJ59677.1 hypothetical protein A6V36_27180 [Paraburkholderia ginsengiterrae]OAJ64947.1 hypothetical protein A6V37_16340 [Paraburkholderia ginsengiterrae]